LEENTDGTWEIDWDKAVEDGKINEKTSVFNAGNIQSSSAKDLMASLNKRSKKKGRGRHR